MAGGYKRRIFRPHSLSLFGLALRTTADGNFAQTRPGHFAGFFITQIAYFVATLVFFPIMETGFDL